jgi:hypothetical protein
MIQVFKCKSDKNISQLDCLLLKNEKDYDIDFKKDYKIINQKLFGTKREYCIFESTEELIELTPESYILLIEVSPDYNYVKVFSETNGIFWVHKYCITVAN